MRRVSSVVVLVAWFALAVSGSSALQAEEPSCTTPRECEDACIKGDAHACRRIELFLARLCDEQRSALACAHLGSMYGEGGPLPRSLPLWLKYSQKACDLGEGEGCNEVGVAFAQGLGGVAKDDAKAVEHYKKACDLGALIGCRNYGGRLARGIGVARDAATARQVLSKACDADDASSCTHLGNLLEDEHEVDAARRAFEKSCRLGKAQGCHNAAELGAKVDVPVDWRVAEAQRGCDTGMQQDCWELARDYRFGRGVPVDLSKAYQIASRSCAAGWALSCESQAFMLEAGEGAARDETADIVLFEKACKLGSSEACLEAGNRVWKGHQGVAPAPVKAIGWYQRGCRLNHASACLGLGNVLSLAEVRPSVFQLVHGMAVLERACSARVASACEGLATLHRSRRLSRP